MRHDEELLLNDYYTVGCVYGDDPTTKRYTFKVDNSIDLEVGDMVVVKQAEKYKVIMVAKVHSVPNIDFDSPYKYSYIVSPLDTTKFDELAERSVKIAATLEEVARGKLKQELIAQFAESMDEDGIKKLEADCGVSISTKRL